MRPWVLFASVFCLVFILSYAWLHEWHLSNAKPSPLPSLKDITFQKNVVHIPFVLREGSIFVQAYVGSKRVESVLDTGCNEAVWPEWMHLAGRQTGFDSVINDTKGLHQAVKEVVINSINIRGYSIKNVSTYKITGANDPAKQPGTARQYLLLGNSIFLNTILTIDYSKKEIVIQSPDHAFHESKASSKQYRVSFVWLPQDKSQRVGVPAVKGKVNGRPALIEVDTGWNGKNVAISDYLWKSVASKKPLNARRMGLGTALGTTTVEYVNKSQIQIPVHVGKKRIEIMVTSPAVRSDSATSGAGAVIGTAVLSHYRVTIDYPHQLIFLEPRP